MCSAACGWMARACLWLGSGLHSTRHPPGRPWRRTSGLECEGIAARDDRVLMGLRGPVLLGITLVLDLRVGGLDVNRPTLSPARLRYRYLQLSGLAVRDLAQVPGSDDVLVLAGPSMTLAGRLLPLPTAKRPPSVTSRKSIWMLVTP